MQIPSFLKTLFSIPMLLLYWFCFYFRYDLLTLLLVGYVSIFSYGQAFVERLIGESYFSQAQMYTQKAQPYFKKSLAFYEKEIDNIKDKQKKGEMAFLIATQYECGKGVDINFGIARKWYEEAVADGYTNATTSLARLKTEEAKSGHLPSVIPGHCLPPPGK